MIGYLRSKGERRRHLAARSDAQRAALAASAQPLVRTLGALDRALAVVRAHPFLVGIAAGTVAFAGRGRLLGVAGRALAAYSLLRRL